MARWLRLAGIGLVAVLTAAIVVRSAVVQAWAEDRPAIAASLWPSHPEMLRLTAMGEVGSAAAIGQEPSMATLRRLRRLASAAPLMPEPFLVRAAMAVRRGNSVLAEQLLIEARTRDPRSRAARFLLADLYFSTNRNDEGFAELLAFSKLVPGANDQLAPMLASYAQTPGAASQIKKIIAITPELEPKLLVELAKVPENADLILDIATPLPAGSPAPEWQGVLVGKLVEREAYNRAYEVWEKLAGARFGSGRGLFNPRFGQSNAPPPLQLEL